MKNGNKRHFANKATPRSLNFAGALRRGGIRL